MSQLDDKPAQTRDIALDTYRYLRGGMVVMIVMLGAAVIGEKLTATCWQTSISAYFFTSAHRHLHCGIVRSGRSAHRLPGKHRYRGRSA